MNQENEVNQSQEHSGGVAELSPLPALEQGLDEQEIAACRCGSDECFPCRVASENHQINEWQVRCPRCARRGPRAEIATSIELWNSDVTA